MYSYKITKYYSKNKIDHIYDEWTSIYDIGKEYGEKIFLYEEYIKTEDKYIETILSFVNLNKIKYMTIEGLEKNALDKIVYDEYDLQIEGLISNIQNKQKIDIDNIGLLARAILREKIWAKLYNSDKLYIHFGYDYYMYIGSKAKPKKKLNI